MIWLLGAALGALILFLSLTYICYLMAFSVPNKHFDPKKDLPTGEQYAPHNEDLKNWIADAEAIAFEEVYITAKDGTRLLGRYYETDPKAPVQVLLHGYRSYALRDFCGGLVLALKCGHNALLVDQRAHGKSGGRCLSFGINERHDCLSWIEYARTRLGEQTKIILSGLSMGASTVLMASSLPLPENVVGIIADCGYSSPEEIIREVLSHSHYPKKAAYALVRLGGRIWGGFDIESCTATDALTEAKVPVLFIHGDDDRFVPYEMSVKNHAACQSEKYFLSVAGAGHGLSYTIAPKEYKEAVIGFIERVTR